MAASRVTQLLQKLSGAHVSSRDRLVSCQAVADALPASPDALASFSSHKGAGPCTISSSASHLCYSRHNHKNCCP